MPDGNTESRHSVSCAAEFDVERQRFLRALKEFLTLDSIPRLGRMDEARATIRAIESLVELSTSNG